MLPLSINVPIGMKFFSCIMALFTADVAHSLDLPFVLLPLLRR